MCEKIVVTETEKPYTNAKKLATWIRKERKTYGHDVDGYPCSEPEFKDVEWEIILGALDQVSGKRGRGR